LSGTSSGFKLFGKEIGCGRSRRKFSHQKGGGGGVTGGWKKLFSVELYELYCSPSIRVVKSNRMQEDAHVECVRKKIIAYNLWVWKPEGKNFGNLKERVLET
jgi:hypothetical protein